MLIAATPPHNVSGSPAQAVAHDMDGSLVLENTDCSWGAQ